MQSQYEAIKLAFAEIAKAITYKQSGNLSLCTLDID
jgi:hypothetical protein